MGKRAALYARVSTQEQAERNYSLDSQRDKLRAYCDLQGWAAAGEYVDAGYSGTTDKRPELSRLLRAVEAREVDVIVVYKLDRFFRSQRLLHNALHLLETHGVGLASATESFDTTTPMGRAMVGMLGTFAQLERDTFIERSMDGTRKAVTSGKYTGGIVAYGYNANPETKGLDIEPTEADVVRRIYLWASEGLTTHTISRRLNELGIPTKYSLEGRGVRHKATSGVWRPGRVLNLLKNPAYKGEWVYGRRTTRAQATLTAGTCPAIVSPDLWGEAQRRLAANATFSPRNAKREYLLRSLIKCACGHSYVGSYYTLADGTEVRQYRCTSRMTPAEAGPPCDNPPIPAAFVEDLVWRDVREYLLVPEYVADALNAVWRVEGGGECTAELARHDRRLEELRADEAKVLDLYVSGTLSRGALDAKGARIDLERRGVLSMRAEAERDHADGQARKARLAEIDQQLRTLATRLDEPDGAGKVASVRALVSTITVGRDEAGRPSVVVRYVFGEPTPPSVAVGDRRGTGSKHRSARSPPESSACPPPG